VTDIFSKSKRSQIMRSVRSSGTGPEKKCEAILRALKIPFKSTPADLSGRPDFILPRSNLAIFVHGCFWHAHKGCKHASLPASNVRYWTEKIDKNRKRDRRVRDALRKAGWRTAVIWECSLKKRDAVSHRLWTLSERGHRAARLSKKRYRPQ
jgi:DNA mismatch endonuclease (patch repair protein)